MGTIIILVIFAIPLFVVAGWLIAKATALFTRSRVAWVASAILLPHFAGKLMDSAYDAVIAGNYLYAALCVGALILDIAGISSLVKTSR